MKKLLLSVIIAAAVFIVPVLALAAGGHDGLTCTGCHALHTAKEEALIFAVDANKKDVNPKTKQAYRGITALCLGCHETPEKGGQGIKPISGHMSHPYGIASVNQKVAKVPAQLLRDGSFECISCHDPHPSNTNYKYLRVETANGAKMETFCAVCHPMKADPKASAEKVRMFTSMDEQGFGTMSAEGAGTRGGPVSKPAKKANVAAKKKTAAQ
jgi:predicted CXXCH cytochrome family protein